jgi:hypothetical protein
MTDTPNELQVHWAQDTELVPEDAGSMLQPPLHQHGDNGPKGPEGEVVAPLHSQVEDENMNSSSVTVSEYVKSWMRDISNALWWKPTKIWSSKRFAVKKPTKRVRPQSSGRNFRPYKRRWIQPKARWSKQKRRSTRFKCMMEIIAHEGQANLS